MEAENTFETPERLPTSIRCKGQNQNINKSGNEKYYLLGCGAVKSVRMTPTFRKNILFPSSGPKFKPSKNQTETTAASLASS
jgi:hypothetical protein